MCMFGFLTLLFTLLVATIIPETISTVLNETVEAVVEQQEGVAEHVNTENIPPQQIVIKNAIEPTMLQYKHWTGTYSPEIFNVTINETLIATGETYAIDSTEKPILVQFDYSFMNGIRKGSKKISYQINKDCTQATLTFSWHDTFKILIDNATPIKEETIS